MEKFQQPITGGAPDIPSITLVIKETSDKILSIMGVEAETEIGPDETGLIKVNINTPEAGVLIGQNGANLYALQHLIRLIVNKKVLENQAETNSDSGSELKEMTHFILDVNSYRSHKTEVLKQLALDKAQQAISEARQISLYPMPPYERKVIHMVLGERTDVSCESEGEGVERHIVIKPLA